MSESDDPTDDFEQIISGFGQIEIPELHERVDLLLVDGTNLTMRNLDTKALVKQLHMYGVAHLGDDEQEVYVFRHGISAVLAQLKEEKE